LPDLPERNSIWKRFLIGGALTIVTAAATAMVVGFNQVDRIARAFTGDLTGLKLAEAAPGKPQTILLIGSDKRAKSARDAELGSGNRSDTMILMRLDPERGAIALMSLPRDLKVHIPGYGIDKLNAAYAEGGTELTVETIKELTGLTINHVINVDFRGFREAVNAIDCVYADVDRRYFNDNSGGDQYAKIDIQPGYQKLCGGRALQYVRYRHTDSDIVRAARQQDFLRQAKAQVGFGRLIEREGKLVKIVSKYTRSDIEGRKQVLTLLKLALNSAGSPVQEIHFPAHVGASYVTADADAVRKVTREFLGVKSSKGPRGTPQQRDPSSSSGSSSRSTEKKKASSSSDLVDISAAAKQQALNIASHTRGIKIYYPRRGVSGTAFSTVVPQRAYKICTDHHKKCYRSYRMVLERTNLIGEYYGIQATTWRNPPILKDASETRTIGGRQFQLFYDGDRLRLVAWREKDAVYWVSNTLLQSLSTNEMLEIARYTKPL
jgi:LCP family protein required for cell wall assembly